MAGVALPILVAPGRLFIVGRDHDLLPHGEQRVVLFENVLLQEFQVRATRAQDVSSGGGPGLMSVELQGDLPHEPAAHLVLLKHHPDQLTFARRALVCKAGEQATLLLGVVTPVDETLTESDQIAKECRGNRAGPLGVAQPTA